MNNNKKRISNFTSSEIWKLMKFAKNGFDFGAPALTYIHEKAIAYKLGRSVNLDGGSRATSWGKFVEGIVFDKLGLEYSIVSQDTILHPTLPHWSGSPDLLTIDSVADIKCYYPKNFADYADCLKLQNVEAMKKDFEAEYWQLVSNSCLKGLPYGEAIVYLPYKSELDGIKKLAYEYEPEGKNALDKNQVEWIYYATDNSLPYQNENNFYKNIERFKFLIPQDDKDLLTTKVIAATKLLYKEIGIDPDLAELNDSILTQKR